LVNRKLLAVAAKKIRRLMVLMPPRRGKSLLISRYFPAWYLGLHPDHRVIQTGYGNDFAEQWGGQSRDTLARWGPVLFRDRGGRPIQVDPRRAKAGDWGILDHEGGLFAAGVGGGITGRGMDIGICDDPTKSAEEAMSEAHRQRVWDWWQSEFTTRLTPDGAIVLILTRWHRDDLAGRLLRQQTEHGSDWDGIPWDVVSLPELAEEGDLLGRQPGEPLWPERWPLAESLRTKASMSAFWWAALYQQRPTQHDAAEWPDSLFGESLWFDHWPTHDTTQFRVMACDPSKGKDTARRKGDFSAIVQLALATDGTLYVDASIERRSADDIARDLARMGRDFGPLAVGFEANGFQELMGPVIVARSRLDGFALPLVQQYNSVKKESRIRLLGPYLERGELRFRRGSRGAALLVEQLKAFPLGDHDDGPDALEMAVRLAREIHGGVLEPPGTGADSRYDSVVSPGMR
jgi:predicted phage terminase large subunit-like protein